MLLPLEISSEFRDIMYSMLEVRRYLRAARRNLLFSTMSAVHQIDNEQNACNVHTYDVCALIAESESTDFELRFNCIVKETITKFSICSLYNISYDIKEREV